MDAELALMSLISGIGSTLLLVILGTRRFEGRGVTMRLSVVSALLWVAIAFAQNVALTWLASLTYAAYAISTSVRVWLRRMRPEGHAKSVIGVAGSIMETVCVTAGLNILILFVLALVEKVIPYYVSLV